MNKIAIRGEALDQIRAAAELSYPDEGAGLLFGETKEGDRVVAEIHCLGNRREGEARRRRYLIEAGDMLSAEKLAESKGLEVVGVFHSHPDHPARPSDTDREWALPWYSYVITSVDGGEARQTSSWHLREDRSGFEEECIERGVGADPGLGPAVSSNPGEERGAD
ncbi:MAG: M67 family metallopeptidase [Anaerolineales bacterium]|jgi:proteasome lid subunit RPN8/RPN11